MPDDDTRTILEAIKDQGGRTEHAIESMADRLVEAITHWGKKNGHATYGTLPDRSADVKMIAVVVAIMFGLASPLGITMLGLSAEQRNLREDLRVLLPLTGAVQANAANIDAAKTRCDAHSVRDERTMEKMQDWQSDHDLRVRGLNAAQWERIRSLERQVFGGIPPEISANGW